MRFSRHRFSPILAPLNSSMSNPPLNWLSRLKSFHLRYLSKPKSDRILFRLVHRYACRSVVEVGLTDLTRTVRLLQGASWHRSDRPVRYTGIDSFDAREEDQPSLTLKEAHQRLAGSSWKARFAPGPARFVLRRLANELAETDLLLFSSHERLEENDDTWYYIPRMLHESSIVLVETVSAEGDTRFQRVSVEEIERRAEAAARRRRRAA